MKILKKLAVAIFLFFIVGAILFLYFNYKSDGISFLTNQKIFTKESSTRDENTAFSDYTVSYVEDPDLGAVRGTAEISPTAKEFREWLDKGWASSNNSVEPATEMYSLYLIVQVSDNSVEARMFDSTEIKPLSLECLPENTALYKNTFYVMFVSANFDVKSEIRSGDWLYANCLTEVCNALGPECIIMRKP